MSKNDNTALKIRSAAVVAGTLTVMLAIVMLLSHCSVPKSGKAVREGVSFIQEQVSVNTAPVESQLHKNQAEELKTAFDADMQQALDDIENDRTTVGSSIWKYFKDYVVLGDSRAVGFYYYDFLEESRVIADGGHTIRDVPNALETIAALRPSYIYMCYGLNDTGIGYWDTGEQYAAEFSTVIDQLRQTAPGATIVVSSILPATPAAIDGSPAWGDIPEFSAAVEKLCKEKNVLFVNNDELAATYMDTMWDEDGVHLHKEFYPYWARNLLVAVMENES